MRAIAAAFSLVVFAAAACATAPRTRLAYAPAQLREEIARRAPGIPRDEVAVPHEVTPEQVEAARAAVRLVRTPQEKARALSEALVSPNVFGVRYAWSITGTALETLRTRRGNCLGLASAYVGLARAVGLEAYFIDASVQVHEVRYGGGGMVINAGHVTAMVKVGDTDIGLDFAREGRIVRYRVLSDVEALAHFYNNRGYDLMDRAEEEGQPVPWDDVAHQFDLATQVWPTFAQAWNNLGLAHARLGRRDEATRDYRTAIASDRGLAAPRNNLALLLLEAGQVDAAIAELTEASRLEPGASHVQFNLANALLRRGDRDGAAEALRRAMALRRDYPEARALLLDLTRGTGTP